MYHKVKVCVGRTAESENLSAGRVELFCSIFIYKCIHSLRDKGQGFPPATESMTPNYFNKKNRKVSNQKNLQAFQFSTCFPLLHTPTNLKSQFIHSSFKFYCHILTQVMPKCLQSRKINTWLIKKLNYYLEKRKSTIIAK